MPPSHRRETWETDTKEKLGFLRKYEFSNPQEDVPPVHPLAFFLHPLSAPTENIKKNAPPSNG